jgi:MFS family permease
MNREKGNGMKAGVKHSAAVRFGTTFRAFENRGYVCMWFSNCLSDTSRWMQLTLVAWLVLELTDSPWHVSLVGFFLMLPTLVLGLAGGVLADEMDRRRLLIMMLGACIAACLGMTLVLAGGAVKPWQAYLPILITGTAWALGFPSRRALIFDLLGASGVTNAVALDTVGMNVSRVLGPGLGGILISLTGVVGGYAAVTLFYTISFVLLMFMHVESLPQKKGRNRGIFRNLLEGFRYVRHSPPVLAVVLITVAMNLLLFPFIPMVSVMARDVLHVGPTLMGILQAAQGFGAVIGAILIASAGSISFHGRIFVIGALLSMIGLGLFAMSPWYGLSFPSLLCLGLGASGFATIQAALVMLVAQEEMRGRALGVVSLAIGAGPIGSLMLGAMASWVGPAQALALNSLVGVVAVTVIAVSIPSIIDRTQPD